MLALRKVNLMNTTKTTVNLDEEVWEEFKKTVNTRYGSTRNLSNVVEAAISNYNMVMLLRSSAKKMELDVVYPSSNEVEEKRPSSPVDSAKVLREMRDGRQDRLLGQ